MAEESKTEQACRAYAESVGCQLYKIKFSGRVGCPDRMLVIPEDKNDRECPARIIFIEFKSSIMLLSSAQIAVHREMIEMGLDVWTISSLEKFREILGD